jgi:hypothetical protein
MDPDLSASVPDGAFAVSEPPSEAYILSKLSPEVAESIRIRLDQELQSIDRERERLSQAMNDEILHMKQRCLYDVCGKMNQLAHQDTPNRALYDELYPDVFCRFTEKNTRQRMRKKPKFQKLSVDIAALSRPLPRVDILLDLNVRPKAEEVPVETEDNVAMVTTKLGQRWMARVARKDGLMALTYCDGSSSLLTETDAKTLGIGLAPWPGK